MITDNSLEVLYGKEFENEAIAYINELENKSNFDFTYEIMEFGTSFMILLARDILEGKRRKLSLKLLVNESFGLAAMAYFNR